MTSVELDTPLGGWSHLALEDDNKRGFVAISYIDGDVASYILKEFCKFLTFDSTHILLEFDGENVGDQLIMMAGKSCCVWENAYTVQCKTFNVSVEDFIEKVTNEIEKNLTEWASFNIFFIADNEYDSYDIELESSKKKLNKLIKKVRKELKVYRDTFKGIDK